MLAEHSNTATWIGFAMMCLGMFMAILDVQVVATSIPTIQAALNVAPDQMSWIQTAYLIAEVVAIPLTGFLTGLLTLRWLFVVSVSLFTLASLGCGASTSFTTLIFWRVLQGFSGGTLIPAVFSAVFLLFPVKRQGVATTIAGVLAVLAPTVGPIVGGWITQTYSWHWLFLINALPGLLAATVASRFLPFAKPNWAEAKRMDLADLILMATALASLVIALKEAPSRGWISLVVLGLLALSALTFTLFIRRSLASPTPVVNFHILTNHDFAIGCLLSFVLGIGLFGSVYMMPVFLAYTHGYGALRIGQIMLITGIAQLLTAPLAVAVETRTNPRLLSLLGFALFALGLGLSAFQTEASDFNEMLWPQVIRGVAIMFCLLPPTRMALGRLPPELVPDASGLFNLMRNLGGAIGLALIDTVLYSRTPVLGTAILTRLQSGDIRTAQDLGLTSDMLAHLSPDTATLAMLEPLVAKLAFVQAMNEAWALTCIITVAAVAALIALRFTTPRPPKPAPATR